MPKTYQLDDLIYLMGRLRDKETGCPWDLAQTWKDIIPHTLEEVYEVIDAIQNQDWSHVEEELGDLLFQIIFYSQLAREQQYFDFAAVVNTLVSKLVRRHPHVFPDGDLYASMTAGLDKEQIKGQWDLIKSQEKISKNKSINSLLDDVPRALPAIQRMVKVQKKASKTGLDWDDAIPVFQVVRDELDELEQAYLSGIKHDIQDELGDVFFSLVNLSRKLNVDPEQASDQAIRKFTKRFQWIENKVSAAELSFEKLNAQALDKLWIESKKHYEANS